jgi:VWFA-related protein
MKFQGTRITFGVVLSILLAACTLAAQIRMPQQKSPPQVQQPLKVQVEMVHLFATVRGRHGNIVSNLTKKDFRVYENGKQQKIAYFSREMNLPLTLGLLIDTSGSQQDLLGAEQDAAKQFLKQILTPKDLAFVITFDTDVNLMADFTTSLGRLDKAIDRARINAPLNPSIVVNTPFPKRNVGTVFYDAVYLACHDKLAGEAGRKALIVLTDAQDYGSTETLDDAIDAAQRSDTVVHVLLVANPYQYMYAGIGGYRGGSVAEKLARQTGGRVIRVSNSKQLAKAFKTLSEELRSQYVIGYYSTDAARDGTFRKVKIKTTEKHDKVLTRSGYYASSQ